MFVMIYCSPLPLGTRQVRASQGSWGGFAYGRVFQ